MSETISRSFTFVKDGVYYFSRRIPKELKCHYKSSRIAFSLRTKSARIAEARAKKGSRPIRWCSSWRALCTQAGRAGQSPCAAGRLTVRSSQTGACVSSVM